MDSAAVFIAEKILPISIRKCFKIQIAINYIMISNSMIGLKRKFSSWQPSIVIIKKKKKQISHSKIMKFLKFFLEIKTTKRKTINLFKTIFRTHTNFSKKSKIIIKIMIKNRLSNPNHKKTHQIYQYLRLYNHLQHFQDCQ